MYTPSRDTDPKAHAVHVSLLREAGPVRRAALCLSLSAEAIRLSRRAVRRARPELDEREALLEWVRITYGPELAAGVRDRV